MTAAQPWGIPWSTAEGVDMDVWDAPESVNRVWATELDIGDLVAFSEDPVRWEMAVSQAESDREAAEARGEVERRSSTALPEQQLACWTDVSLLTLHRDAIDAHNDIVSSPATALLGGRHRHCPQRAVGRLARLGGRWKAPSLCTRPGAARWRVPPQDSRHTASRLHCYPCVPRQSSLPPGSAATNPRSTPPTL